jgi:hypothetical protein
MAASTDKMVKSQAGEMFDVNSPQGKTIVASATVGKDADFASSKSNLGANTSITETLKLIYEETQESGESLDNIEESLAEGTEETAAERAARLKKSNKEKTEKKENKFGKAMGFAKNSIGAGLSKAKGALSGKLGLALLGGGLVLLNKYGGEIAGPDGWLTKFLKYMKEQLIPDIKALYEDLQVWWDIGWGKVNSFFTYIQKVFEQIGAYMDKFDTDGTPGLSEDELKLLKEDMLAKASSFAEGVVTAILTGAFSSITGVMLAAFAVGGVAYRLLLGAAQGVMYRITSGISGKGKPSADGPKTRKARGSFIKNSLKTIAAYAVSGSVGATAQNTKLKPGERLNKVGSIIGKDGKIIKTAKNVSFLTKYPRLAKALKIPLLGTIIAGALVARDMNDDTLSKDEKTRAIGGHIGGGLGAAGFGAVGASLGAFFGPPGAIIGGILGSLAGFGLGDKMGQVLAGFLLGETTKPLDIPLQSSSALGASVPSDSAASTSSGGGFSSLATSVSPLSLSSLAAINPANYAEMGSGGPGTLAEDQRIHEAAYVAEQIKAELQKGFNFGGSTYQPGDTGLARQLEGRTYGVDGDLNVVTPGYETSFIDETGDKYGQSEQNKIGLSDQILKTNQLIAQQDAKNLMREMKADNAKQNKFNTFNSRDQRTSTEINQANYVAGMSARNDFWQEYYGHKAATN